LRENALILTSTVEFKLLRLPFSLKKQRKPPETGTQRHYSQRHYSHRLIRLIVVFFAIVLARTSRGGTFSVAHSNFEFQNSVSEGASFELLRLCSFLLSENKYELCDVAPTKLIVICIAGELKIEVDSTARLSSRTIVENIHSNEGASSSFSRSVLVNTPSRSHEHSQTVYCCFRRK
jgi:hypothetical protein